MDCDRLVYNEYDNGYYLGNEKNPYLALVTAKDDDIASCKINEKTKVIGGGAFSAAFSGCGNLASITIPDSVTSIGDSAFYGCDSLAEIAVSSGNKIYYSENNCIIEKASKTLVAGCKNSIIPNNVTSIGYGAFCGYESLTSITIPNSVTSIGDGAFFHCYSLTSITIPDSVTSIGVNAFVYCNNLTSVTFENPDGWYDDDGEAVEFSDPAEAAEELKRLLFSAYTRK